MARAEESFSFVCDDDNVMMVFLGVEDIELHFLPLVEAKGLYF